MKHTHRDVLRRLGALLLSSILLAGCASPTTGPYTEVATPIPEGMARLIIYRANHFVGGGGDIDIGLDNVVVCHIPQSAVLTREVKIGNHKVSADVAMSPGTSVLNVSLKNGETKYVRVGPNPSRIGRAFIPIYGLFGQFIEANDETTRGGAFGIDEPTPVEARAEMKGYGQAGC
jgi:hypothetical protein